MHLQHELGVVRGRLIVSRTPAVVLVLAVASPGEEALDAHGGVGDDVFHLCGVADG